MFGGLQITDISFFFFYILLALVFSFSIPWPPIFSSLLINLTFINIDFSPIFAGMSPCALYTPFMVSAAAHMFLLPAVIIIIAAAPFTLLPFCIYYIFANLLIFFNSK